LGKQLAKQVLVDIDSETMTGQHDGSTQQLIAFYKKYK
jgi:hypothetical protein